jgi:hypothetical protein
VCGARAWLKNDKPPCIYISDVDERGVKLGIELVYARHHARDATNEERMGDERNYAS